LRGTVAVAAFAVWAARAVILYPPAVTQDSLTVGERIGFRVSIVVPAGAHVAAPETEQGFGDFVVKQWSEDRTERESSDSLAFNYVLTLYTTEPCTIPSLPFIHVKSDSAYDTLRSEPVPVRVISVVTSDSADLRDLKPQQIAGNRPLLWLWVLFGAVLALAAAYVAWRLWQKSRKPPPPPPPKPPYEEAIEALARLEAKQYLMKGMVREHVFELSDILKRYVERRFGTNASEYTTEEMLDWVQVAPLDSALRLSLEWFFTEADPVKFAKHVPDRATISRFDPEARSFIEKTRPTPQAPAGQAQPDGGGDAVQGS
jgi:hypothetical protein